MTPIPTTAKSTGGDEQHTNHGTRKVSPTTIDVPISSAGKSRYGG